MTKLHKRTKFSTLSNHEFLNVAQDKIDKLNKLLDAGSILKEILSDAGHDDHVDLLIELLERVGKRFED